MTILPLDKISPYEMYGLWIDSDGNYHMVYSCDHAEYLEEQFSSLFKENPDLDCYTHAHSIGWIRIVFERKGTELDVELDLRTITPRGRSALLKLARAWTFNAYRVDRFDMAGRQFWFGNYYDFQNGVSAQELESDRLSLQT